MRLLNLLLFILVVMLLLSFFDGPVRMDPIAAMFGILLLGGIRLGIYLFLKR